MMVLRNRLAMLLLAVLIVAIGATTYVLAARPHEHDARRVAGPAARASLTDLLSGPHIVFRNTNPRDGYGMLAVVSLGDPSGPRAISGTGCDRLYAAATRIVCLSSSTGIGTTYRARVLDDRLTTVQTLPLSGVPSRTRLSADARYAATTSFVAGDSYAGASFSTRTVISGVGRSYRADLEDFTLLHNGTASTPVDRNFWGVTFAPDDDTFYATAAWGGRTWLVRGSMSRRTLVTVHEDAECPSLSPDGRNVVFKQRGDLPPGKWRLVDYNVATGTVTPLAETRSVDDQAEWLNNSDVLYGLPRQGAQAAVDDVWSVPADGTGRPAVFIPQAWSPAVVR